MTQTAPPTMAKALSAIFIAIGGGTVFGFVAKTWLPPVATEHGVGIDAVINYLLTSTGLILLVGHLVLAWLIWKFGRGDAGPYKPESNAMQWAWAAVPLLLFTVVAEIGVIALGSSVWTQLYGPEPANPVRVEIVGRQFEWMLHYPGKDGKFGNCKAEFVDNVSNPIGLDANDPNALDDIVSRGELVLPVDRPAVFRLRTLDVLHSFSVPHFRIKQDLVPGFSPRVQFKPTRTGSFEITCAELCGLGHYRMRGTVEIKTSQEFDAWLAKQEGWKKK